jgi:hypothetical protein
MLCAASPAAAQRLVTVGVGGGASVPEGGFGTAVDPGWHALGTLVIGTPMQPLGLRLDGAYNDFASGSGRQAVTSGTANITYRLPTPGTPISPYLLAGLGAYRGSCSGGATCSTGTSFGWNAGLGTKVMFLGIRWFVEGRYHSTDRKPSDVNFFPITVGLTF